MPGQSRSANWLRATQGAYGFKRLPAKSRKVVVYSEGESYGKYLRPVVHALVSQEDMAVAYLTSDPTDPMLDEVNSQIAVFFIGSGSIRTFVFQTLAAGVLVTTTPDLHSFHLKRSSVYPVHYAYLHHSIVSTHRAYRPTAFDHFDSVLCVGPHHRRETRAREQLKGLKAKCLFEHGYWPLDWLLEERSRSDVPQTLSDALNVLVAPSWALKDLSKLAPSQSSQSS